MVERNLGYESGIDLLIEIEAGTRSRCLLPWVALMVGGEAPELIDRWKVAADVEPTVRRRGEFARVAKVFAERAGRKAIWDEKLEGWNVEESTVVNEWIAEAKGLTLLRLAAKRFGPASTEVEKAIREIIGPHRVDRMLECLIDPAATNWSELLATP